MLINFDLAVDIMLSPIVLHSREVDYLINNEASFSLGDNSWDEKKWNEIYFTGKLTCNVSTNLGIGALATYSYATESKVDGEVVDDSYSSMFSISPVIGYQLEGKDLRPIFI